MKFQKPCIECSKRQGLRIYQLAAPKEKCTETEMKQLKQVLDERIDAADPDLSPAELSLIAIRTAQKHADCFDPFLESKKNNNRMALQLYPSLKDKIAQSDDPLHLACQLAACGNIIDLGIHDNFDIVATIDKVIREGFQRDHYQEFFDALNRIHQEKIEPMLLYLCDNAGEIVFDKIFMEELKKHYPKLQITAVVRSIPVLNDATLEDAVQTGLVKVVDVIENGNDALGTILHGANPELIERYQSADLIISKGQANYETVSHSDPRVFFILKAKCEVIAESLGVQLWDAVITKGRELALSPV